MATGTTPPAGTPAPTLPRRTPANGGRSYVMTDEQHQLRVFCAFACWTVGVLVVFGLSMFFFRSNYYYGAFVGVALGILMIGESLYARFFIVPVPLVTGLILINPWVKITDANPPDPYYNQIVCTPGWSFKFPWEQEENVHHIDMRIVDLSFEGDFSAGEDGIVLKLHGGFSYRPMMELLPRYIAVSKSVIDGGLSRIMKSVLSVEIAKLDSGTARRGLDGFQQELINKLSAPQTIQGIVDPLESKILDDLGLSPTFEHLFGIDFLSIQIDDADFEKAYLEVLMFRQRATKIKEALDELLTSDLSEPEKLEAMNNILVQFRVVTKDINIRKIEGINTVGESFAAFLAQFGRGGNN